MPRYRSRQPASAVGKYFARSTYSRVPMFPDRQPLIDMHVHIVGNGAGGTGCWIRPSMLRWPLQVFMCRHIGLPLSALKDDLDALYVERLLQQVRASSLDAVVILAQERVYDEQGRVMEDRGT